MPSRDLEARIMDLEILLTHQQRDLADINGQLLEQRRIIEQLQRQLGRMQETSTEAMAPPPSDTVANPSLFDSFQLPGDDSAT